MNRCTAVQARPVTAGIAALLVLLAGCVDDGTSLPSPPAPGGVGPSCFTVQSQPLLTLASPVPNYTWNDPSVLKVGGSYWMYASATDNFVFPVRIYRLVSTDGISWARDPVAPVLSEGGAGAWDEGGVETPAVVAFGGQYHLFYTGYSVQADATTYAVGHATSSDGITWSRDAANPLVAPSGVANDFRQFIVAEPGPVVVGSTLHLYFTAVGINAALANSLQVVGLTTSPDGTSWSAPESVLEPDQGLYPRGAGAVGWVGYSTPNAIVLGGQVHLFHDVAYDATGSDWRQVRLHHARSPDGRTGWVQDGAPFLTIGTLPWTTREVRAPHALQDGTTLRVYFAGDNLDPGNPPPQPEFAIGQATCPL